MLKLSDRSPVAKGRNRACYSHPNDPDRMIKVLLPDATPDVVRKNSKSLRRRWLPAKYLDEQLRELKAFNRLRKRLGEGAWRHIPKFHGTVETDMGLGIETDFARSVDGSAGVNLTRYFPNEYTESVQRSVQELLRWIKDAPLVPRDFGLHNVVICENSDARHHAWLVDGFGSAEFIPLSEWNKSHGQRMAQRRIDRFESHIQDFLNRPFEDVPRYPLTLDR